MVTFVGFVAGNILCAFRCLYVQSHDTRAAYVTLAVISIAIKIERLMLITKFFIMQFLSSSLLSSFKPAGQKQRLQQSQCSYLYFVHVGKNTKLVTWLMFYVSVTVHHEQSVKKEYQQDATI